MTAAQLVKIEQVLFMDIETAPNWLTLAEAPENVQKEWIYKFKFKPEVPKPPSPETLANVNFTPELKAKREKDYFDYFAKLWESEAGLHPEFSRVVCISAGILHAGILYLQSYIHENEGDLLRTFSEKVAQFDAGYSLRLCAHYGKGFDYPYTAKRMLINRIKLPRVLDTAHLKPWENANLDTQELWKFGGMNSAGLPALCMAFGLPTPKDTMDGSEVAAYYHQGRITEVAVYCEKDVLALFNAFKCMRLEQPFEDDSNIVIMEPVR